MEFKSKEEYLAWRAEWRSDYRQLSANIRDLKWAHRHNQRAGNLHSASAVKQRVEADTPRFDAIKKRLSPAMPHWFPLGLLLRAQQRAREMMSARDDSKLAAERCYQACKEAAQAPIVRA